jgi:hypothetical protein
MNEQEKKRKKGLLIALLFKIKIKSNKSPSNVDRLFPRQDLEVHRP